MRAWWAGALFLAVAGAAITLILSRPGAESSPERADAATYARAWGGQRCAPPFSARRSPGACWRPYGAASPFNQRLPPQPRVAAGSAAAVAALTADGGPAPLVFGTTGSDEDWGHPIFWSRRSDPLFTVRCARTDWGRCAIEGHRIRIPDAARAAGGGDGHLAVVDQARGWEYDLWQVRSKPRGGGTIVVSWGGRTRFGPGSDGLGSDATAAHFGLLAGVLRPAELVAGSIRHALTVKIDCDGGFSVYPAMGRGAKCDDTAGAPPQGARFQLTMSETEIRALAAPRWKRAILLAMARYGFFVEDTGGSPWDLAVESGASFKSFGRPDPWEIFARAAGAEREADGDYRLDVASGIDWRGRLRMIDTCVTRRTC